MFDNAGDIPRLAAQLRQNMIETFARFP